MTAVCSPWWPVVRGWSQGRAAHFGGGQRGAPSDDSRLVRLSLLRGNVEAALGPCGKGSPADLSDVYLSLLEAASPLLTGLKTPDNHCE